MLVFIVPCGVVNFKKRIEIGTFADYKAARDAIKTLDEECYAYMSAGKDPNALPEDSKIRNYIGCDVFCDDDGQLLVLEDYTTSWDIAFNDQIKAYREQLRAEKYGDN